MKKRRVLIISLLLVAALALGIGYATITGSLIIDGKVVATAQPFNVYFTEFEAGQGNGILGNVPVIHCDTALGNGSTAKTVMLNIRDMASTNDSITATLTIKNGNDADMNVKVETVLYGETAGQVTSANPDRFTVTTDWDDEVKNIPAGGTETITLTITMTDSCEGDYSGFFRVSLYGSSDAITTGNT